MEYIFTERAHLMCPNMYFGIAMILPASYDKSRISEAFDALSKAHPFLNALLGYSASDNRYYYDIRESSQIRLVFGDDSIDSIDSDVITEQYESVTGYDWNITKEGMLKVTAWKSDEDSCFLFVFHHLLADGRGALDLCREFADLYVKGIIPEFISETLISSVSDLPKDSTMPFISRFLIKRAEKKWQKEGHQPLSYDEYHEYADRFVKNDRVKHTLMIADPEQTGEIIRECREHSVTVNDLLMARMYLNEKTDKIIIAKDLRDSLGCYRKGALGNYSTAFSIVAGSKDSDEFELAAQVHRKVQKVLKTPSDLFLVLQCYTNMDPGLLDAAFMASRGAYDSPSAEFIGKMFFAMDSAKGYSITNLGRIENSNIKAAYFIPPASPAIKMTQGVLTVNGRMIICTSRRDNS